MALCGIYFAMSFIPSPIAFAADTGISFGIFHVGLSPIISAFFLVELASLIPPLNHLRTGGIKGRRTLNKLSLGLAVILCLFYSYQLIALIGNNEDLLAGASMNGVEKFTLILTFSAAAFVVYGIAQAITRFGFGNGLVLFLAFDVCRRQSPSFLNLRKQYDVFASDAINGRLLFLVMILAFLCWALFFKSRESIKIEDKNLKREIAPPSFILPQSLEAWSLPFSVVTLYPMVSKLFGIPAPDFIGSNESAIATSICVIPLSILGYLIFSTPKAWQRALPSNYQIADSAKYSKDAINLVVLTTIGFCLYLAASHWPIGIGNRTTILTTLNYALIALAATILDLRNEYSFRSHVSGETTTIVELDNGHYAAAASALLKSENIPHCIQSQNFRSLFFFFKPIIKMRVMVPTPQVKQAEIVLRLSEIKRI